MMQTRTSDQIVAEVERTMREIYDSILQADIEPWLAILHDPSGQWLLGMDIGDIQETSEGLKTTWTTDPETRHQRQDWESLEIKVVPISPTVAYVLCACTDRKWYFANGQVDRANTAETWVFVLTDDGWRLHSGQTALLPIEG